MAVISEIEENEETSKPKNPSSSSSSTKPSKFNANFDPSNPLGFLEEVFDFLAYETDFLSRGKAEKEIETVVRRAVEKRRKHEEKALKRIKEEVAAATLQPKDAPTPEEKVDVESENGPRVPNKGNGLDMDNYSWTQSLQEVNVNVPVPKGTKSRFVVCEVKRNHLKVGLKGQPPVIDAELCDNVKPDDCYWIIEDQSIISIFLTKHNQMEWWYYLVKGDPAIDTQKFQPESSRLSDLDQESRQTVEKMLFDQRQKNMGLPTTSDMQREEMMNKFMAEHPDVDISKFS